MSSKSGGRKKSQNKYSVIADNRKATFQYEIEDTFEAGIVLTGSCLLYTSPSPRDKRQSRMPSSA